jgi:hypothetical protein
VPSGTALVASLGSFRALGGPASSAGWRAGALRAGVPLPIAGADRALGGPPRAIPGPTDACPGRRRCALDASLDWMFSGVSVLSRMLVLFGSWCSAGLGARRASVLLRVSVPGRLSRGSRSGAPRIPPSGSTVRLATGLVCHWCLSGRRVCLITGPVWPQGCLPPGASCHRARAWRSRGVPSHRLRAAEGTAVGGGSPVSATGAPLNACRGGQRRAHPLSSMRTGWSGGGRPVRLRVALGLAVRRLAGRARRLRRRRAPGSTR